MQPAQIDAIVFDVIGTLVDEDATWTSATERLARVIGGGASADLRARWTGRLDELMQAVVAGDAAWRPHRELVVDAARTAVAHVGAEWSADAQDIASAVAGAHGAWPDVAAGTAALRRHRLVAGLSNGDPDALARVANRGAISWDIVLSAGAVHTFKPAPAAYRHAIATLRIDPSRTLFVAAHPWDLRAAARHGFRTAYVARPGAERPSDDDRFDLTVDDLADLAALLADDLPA